MSSYEARLETLPASIRRWYDWAHWLTHGRAPDGYEPDYGHWPGGDPRLFCPDIELNTDEELTNWAAACEAAEHGEGIPPHSPSYPDHPFGCSRDERFGYGSFLTRMEGTMG